MQDKFIDFILKINKKYFFKKLHPFNISKNWVMNLNYSDFEYEHAQELLNMYEKITPELFHKKLITNPGVKYEKGSLDSIFMNKEILEVWCWAWWKSVYIAEKYNSNVTWIDIEDNFLEQAEKFARQKNVDKNVQFYKKSALDSGFENNSFDVIIMSDVIEHIPETEKLFEEMYRILKKWWIMLFDFAPYYHYFGHHLWDTIQIPWIHLFFTDKFLIRLYKKSVEWLVDWDARVELRISKINTSKTTPGLIHKKLITNPGVKYKEYFWYLNKIKRNDFEKIVWRFLEEHKIKESKINYYMLKEMNFLSKVPFIKEILIRHIVWVIKK